MGLQRFERRLERLVEGTFAKAFRAGIEPVEIGRKIARALDAGRRIGVQGGWVVPNDIVVSLSSDDMKRFSTYSDVLSRELADAARAYARDEGYHFLGPVTVALVEDDELRTGQLDVEAEIVEGPADHLGALVLPDGRRVPLGDQPAVIGRLPDCAVTLADAQVSRRHAEVRPLGEGFAVADLGSMNGTTVNGVAVRERALEDGDEIGVGSTTIRFEAS
ncbi:MAG TPA: DUF3662 and FHA domain-containing protein [Acidimicrobiia bacterium]